MGSVNRYKTAGDEWQDESQTCSKYSRTTVRDVTTKQPHNSQKWLDRSEKLPQHAGDRISLGECRFRILFSGFFA